MSMDDEFVPVRTYGMSLDDIKPGGVYIYANQIPAHATGQQYRILRIVKDVPSYQRKVLVECLTGRDRGVWFVCSLENFRVRYEPEGKAR